jgi:hypothetical protein
MGRIFPGELAGKVRYSDEELGARFADAPELLDGRDYIRNVLQDVVEMDLLDGVIRKWIRKAFEIMHDIDAG